jgi:hypothetical protein
MPAYRPVQDRFEEKYKVNEITGCWEWIAALDKRGYGVLSINNKPVKTHRLSYSLYKGDPTGLFVCHTCDNPPCVNPKHLFLGTQLDNMKDAQSKGRIKTATCPSETMHRKYGCRCDGCNNLMADLRRKRLVKKKTPETMEAKRIYSREWRAKRKALGLPY